MLSMPSRACSLAGRNSKTASVVGLVGGLRSTALGRATSLGLTTCFVLAVGAHIRARDFGRNFAAANTTLVTVVAVTKRFWTDPPDPVSRTRGTSNGTLAHGATDV